MHPLLIKIGSFSLHTYGIFVALGFLFGISLALKEAREQAMDPQKILDLALYITIAAIVGSRVFYILANWQFYWQNPWDAAKVWKGGLVFYGGFIFAFFFCLGYFKKKNLPFWKTGDIFAPSLALGHAVGRIGCFFAGCCYGKPTHLPWGVAFTDPLSLAPLNISLHPTQLYSAFGNLIIFLVLINAKKKKKFDGQIIGEYLILYPIFRFTVEIFRGDERGFIFAGLLSTSQVISIFMLIVALIIVINLQKKV